MKRTESWWAGLTKSERSRLVHIERGEKLSSTYGAGGYIPDDCCECWSCGAIHLGSGVCPQCRKDRYSIISKADKAEAEEE